MTFVADQAPLVVDASVAVEVAVEPAPDLADAWRAWADDDRMMLVPSHFWPETANGLVRGIGLTAAGAIERLADLRGAGLEVADRGARGLDEALVLAERHGLSVYDALYLQLALDVDGALVTYDRALARAAEAEGVALEDLG